jgi:branched-chain amino acid transport system substrate-binding protein
MWADEVNARGGIKGKKVRLVTCNDEGRPDKAVACTRDAVRDGASLVLAHSLTASLKAMEPILAANGPIMIIASPNIMPSATSAAFQTSPSDNHITEAIADFLLADKLNSLGMIAATDASGEVSLMSAKTIFDQKKIKVDMARVDLKATDATSQIAAVAGPNNMLVYSAYSGGGAAIVLKSFTNLGLKQPFLLSYANLSEAFIGVVKDFLPPRLLGTGVRSLVPSSMSDPVLRDRAEKFAAAYKAKYNEQADMINILGKFDADVAEAVLTNVDNPADVKAAKAYLESNVVESLHRIKFSPQSHVGLTSADIIIAEYKNGRWQAADPLR